MADEVGASLRKQVVDDLLAELGVPRPICKHGYPYSQLYAEGHELSVFRTKEAYEDFNKWMFGQTIMLCNGPATKSHIDWLNRMQIENPDHYRPYDPDDYCKVEHDTVVYSHDLYHYLLGSAPID